jgi:AraC family transcriptional regulator
MGTGLSRPPSDARPHGGFTRLMHGGVPLAVHLRYTDSDFGSSGPYMAETFGHMPSYLCVYQLHDYPATDGWRDGRHFAAPALPSRSLLLLDLRNEWQTRVSAPFHNIHLNVTQAKLDELTEDCGIDTVEIDRPYAPIVDETLEHLARSLEPAFRDPVQISALFAEHVATAAATHLIRTHAGRRIVERRRPGGLAPWQARLAIEFIRENLDTDIELAQLSAMCGLSPSHFGRAFKRTVGMPPHRWLLRQRVERACQLLAHSDQTLESVALACGFADQSHLTRAFTRAIGASPGAWRRQRRT